MAITQADGGSSSSSSNFLDGIFAANGIDPSMIGGMASGPQGPEYVYAGGQIVHGIKQQTQRGTMLRAGGMFPAGLDEAPSGFIANTRSISDLQGEFEDSSRKNKRHMALLLALAGYAGDSVTPDKAGEWAKEASLNTVYQLHLQFLKEAGGLFQQGRHITPTQYLKKQIDYRLGDKWDGDLNSLAADHFSGGSSLAGTHTSTSTDRDIMSAEDARGLVRGLLQQELGRDPTQAEYEDFVSALQAAQRQNPVTTKTTTTTDENGLVVNSNSTKSGGIDAQNFLTNKIQETPGWGEWQAIGTYAPAMMAALDSPVSGV